MMRTGLRYIVRSLPCLLLVCVLMYGCSKPASDASFTLEIYPTEMHGAVAGETRVFLVRILPDETSSGENAERYPLQIECPGVRIDHAPETLAFAEVGEIHVIPDPESAGDMVELGISTLSEGPSAIAQIHVTETTPTRDAEWMAYHAQRARDTFVPWLETEHPELGITRRTEWVALPTRNVDEPPPYYCLLQSAEWELAVWWYGGGGLGDWARMTVRHRTTDFTPRLGARVLSLRSDKNPRPMDVPVKPVR